MAGIESNLAWSPVLDVVDRGTQPPVRGGAAKLQAALGGRSRLAPYDAVRFVLAATLFAAAALKGYQLTTSPVTETDLFTSRWFLIAVVELELVLGFWLLGAQFPRQTRYVILGCFSLFGAVSLFRALRGDASCGCFGTVTVSPWLTALLDGGAVMAMLVFKHGGSSPPRPIATYRVALPLAASVLIGVPAGALMASFAPATLAADGSGISDAGLVILEPEAWIGKRLPILPHIDIGDRLGKGQWRVVLYHDDCPECRKALAVYKQLWRPRGNSESSECLALIEVPPFTASPAALNLVADMVHGSLDATHDWFVATPIELTLNSGIVGGLRSHPEIAAAINSGRLPGS